jgi:DNA-binding MurR/RpiR family transcriptional regulator
LIQPVCSPEEGRALPHRKRDTVSDAAGFNELRSRIVERYPRLSQQQQTIATFALAQPETMAMETAEQLAARLGVQPSALVRFAHALDYAGFREMKQRFKAHLLFRTGDPGSPPTGAAGTGELAGTAEAIAFELAERGITELQRLRRDLDREAFRKAVDLLRPAPQPCVTAQHLAYPIAALLAWSLIRLGRPCLMLDNTGGYALPQAALLRPEDLLVAISIAPYQPSVIQAAQAHAERDGKVLAITDTVLSPLAPHATVLLEIPGFERSDAAPLAGLGCIVQALAIAATRKPDAADNASR